MVMHDDTCIGRRSVNNIKCVVHDDLRWKNQTTRYILPRHWLYEWFSQFHGTYLFLSQSPSIVMMTLVLSWFCIQLWHWRFWSAYYLHCRLQNIQVIFLLLGIAMGLFAIVLLLFGFMSTGVTREYICEGTKCVRSGVSCAVLVSSCGSQYTSHSRRKLVVIVARLLVLILGLNRLRGWHYSAECK